MIAKVEIYTFNIHDENDNDVKIKFEGDTLETLFTYLKNNMPNKINEYPPNKDKKTFKIDTYLDTETNKKKSCFEFSNTNKRIDGIFVVGSDADKILKFTSADKDKKDNGQKEKGVNIDRNHYFQILFIEGSDTGFFVLEKNQKTCKKDFCDILENILNQRYSGVKLSVNQFIEEGFYRNYLEKGKYNSVTCVRKGIKTEDTDGIMNIINKGDYKIETKITPSGDLTEKFKTKVIDAFENKKHFIEIPEFENINYNSDNNSYLIINSEFNNKSRTIDLSDVLKVKPLYDVDDVKENADGSSNFSSIRQKVNELLFELGINLY